LRVLKPAEAGANPVQVARVEAVRRVQLAPKKRRNTPGKVLAVGLNLVQLAPKKRRNTPGKVLAVGLNLVQLAPKKRENPERAAAPRITPSASCTDFSASFSLEQEDRFTNPYPSPGITKGF
jgi:hypothetical protein